MGPVLPPRSAMCGPPSHHYSAPLNFRKGFTFTKCTWNTTSSGEKLELDDGTKLSFVEDEDDEEKLPNDDPLAHVYEHLGAVDEVELISLEDGPISGEEMRKARNKLFYQNVQEREETVEIHTLPPPEEEEVKPEPTVLLTSPSGTTPATPVYLVREGNETAESVLPRLLVNISIASDHGSGTVQHSVYVLQVSIPTPPEHVPKPAPQEEPPSSCPPGPPPAPPCPIKCPNSSTFEKYRVVSIIDDDGSESTEEEDYEAMPSTTTLEEET
ncbi:hypothetical protein pipiens_000499, partial [Culex pipiens pipiens]